MCLGGRHALHAMHAALILQHAIYIVTTHGKVYLLVSSYSTLRDAGHAQVPTFRVAELLVHAEQVAGKQSCLVAAGSGTNLHLYVLGILRILGHEGNLDFLFQLRLQSLIGRKLFTGHLFHVGVTFVSQNILGFGDGVETLHISLAGVHDVAKILVLFGQLDVSLLVGYHGWVRNQRSHLFVTGFQPVQLL